MSEPLTAQNLLDLLAQRHAKDVFVPECKDGPTQLTTHLRMDAWAMPRSWAHPEVTAYEIKVSRGDFLQDQKWPRYLDLSNAFYFVTPPKLVDPQELPPEAGLLWASKNRARLYSKKRAPVRQVEIPESVFRYILMCRATIGSEYRQVDRMDQWRRWLRETEERKEIGRLVRGRIREIVEATENRNDRLSAENRALQKVKEILDEAGVNSLLSWRSAEEMRRKIEEQRTGVSRELKAQLEQAQRTIGRLLDQLGGSPG